MNRIAVILGLLSMSVTAWADSPWVGTWVQRGGAMTMTVQQAGDGLKFSYSIVVPGQATSTVQTIQSQLDGKYVPVMINGQPSGQTTAVRKIDDRHLTSITKDEGNVIGTSKSEISADGKVLRIDNEYAVTSTNPTVQKITEYWDRK
jgi:hypothetical protein